MSFHTWVHLNCSGSSCCRLRLTKVLLTEEELPIQITYLNDIWICQNDTPIPGSKTNHGIILEQLTPNGSSSNHKQVAVLNLLIKCLSKQNDGAQLSLLHAWIIQHGLFCPRIDFINDKRITISFVVRIRVIICERFFSDVIY